MLTKNSSGSYVLNFQETDKTMTALAGGKAANLGELCRIKGVQVPEGFCITTAAFKRIMEEDLSINQLLHQLSLLKPEDKGNITSIGRVLRNSIESVKMPAAIREAIVSELRMYGEQFAYAIRSSATAEDLPTASFAGQQDTYLNITGEQSVLQHISKCWASLFTDRAITYRIQNGFNHRKVQLAVIVQKMVFPQAAGILFTADPVTSNRKILSIDAGFGLGEALVSGIVNADVYKVHNGKVIDKKIPVKKLAVYPLKGGGVKQDAIAPELQEKQVLPDEQILELERTGRLIEKHFNNPQDIEWCLADGMFYIVQSRPITTLFPIPEMNDTANHVYVSVGHQQMMTDAMKPLGISMRQLTAARPMPHAGGRMFVDVAQDLASPERRALLTDVLGKSDPLIKTALVSILERGDFIQPLPETQKEPAQAKGSPGRMPADYQVLKDYDPSVVDELITRRQGEITALKEQIRQVSGPALFDYILEDLQRLRKILADPQSFGVVMTGMNAASWINEHILEWLGEKNVADTITQSVPHNITSEMGLALLDAADIIRPYTEVIAYLQQAKDDNFEEGLLLQKGGKESRDAITHFLELYGMRCAGEIDITKTRWSEQPLILVPLILNNIRNFTPGESGRRFERGLQEATRKEKDILDRLKQLPDGEEKAKETQQMIRLLRNLSGYREYPKYDIVSRYFFYKQALLKEADHLVQINVICKQEDIYYLSFEELHELVRTHQQYDDKISQRKEAFGFFEKLTPPRVMTSDGEILTGEYKTAELPANAIAGLAVSAGVVEGRARVILNMEEADLDEGDILVTRFTDPSWTPLFVSIKGLITEVGGLMTHGAVIAREYGLPAVVGMDHATTLIRDGQRIRLNGTEGYAEIL